MLNGISLEKMSAFKHQHVCPQYMQFPKSTKKQNFQTKHYVMVLVNRRRQSLLTEYFNKRCVHDR